MSDHPERQHPDQITLDVFLDQELSEQETSMIRAHLEGCQSCREYTETRRAFFEIIAGAEQVLLTRDISIEVLGTLKQGRTRVLTGVLGLEAILAAGFLLLFGSRIAARIATVFGPVNLTYSAIWVGERISWLGNQVAAGLAAISQSVYQVPLPRFPGLPDIQLTWLNMSLILTGIFFLWLLTNRILIGNAGVERSRYS